MEVLQRFADAIQVTHNPAMQRWKAAGGRIVGTFCTNVPEELILAAGLLPYRIRAPESRDTSESDRYTNYLNCTYCRHVVDEALRGRYDFLDGFIVTNGSDHMRRVCDVFRTVVFGNVPGRQDFFLEYVAAPRVPNHEASLAYYRDELHRLRRRLGEHFQVDITDERLARAIRQANESRRLLRRLAELRKAAQPPVTGAEALAAGVASTCLPRDEFVDEMKTLLDRLPDRPALPAYRKRLFLYGSELDDPEWVRIIEEEGGLVVADGLCFGARMYWDLVDESADPFEAMVRRYYDRWSCPRVMDSRRRQQRVHEMVRAWRADGIVGERLVMCQLWGAERVLTQLEAGETGIPTLWLEREYLLGGRGQMKTRVQAFLESME